MATKICIADTVYVGRWYSLVAYPYPVSDAPFNYTVKFSSNSKNITLIHNTFYVKSVGEITISCVDMNSDTDIVTITAKELPVVERQEYTITPESLDDFMEKIGECGTYAKINVPKGEYYFEVDDTPKDIADGVLIDFNDSVINITTSLTGEEESISYRCFRFLSDHCGIVNANFVGNGLMENTALSDMCQIITCDTGDFHEFKNITFKGMKGFNFKIGGWFHYGYFKPTGVNAGCWKEDNSTNGYIADDGSVITTDGQPHWCMTNQINIVVTPDRSYGVGQSNPWIPSTVRLYDIAFYDENGNFIELRKNQQYFRRYYYPSNAVYMRLGVHQSECPPNHVGRDDYCIMRMAGGNANSERYTYVSELMADNIYYHDNDSGAVSVTGGCGEIHFNRIWCHEDGTTNPWSFDVEDGWNSMCDITVSHSWLRGVYNHGVQGISYISTVMHTLTSNSNVHFSSLINSIMSHCNYVYDLRCNMTSVNSYMPSISHSGYDDYENVYEFGNLTEEQKNKVLTGARAVLDVI